MRSNHSLASLRERIREATADKVIGKLVSAATLQHFNHGWRGDCECSVCTYRRRYAAKMNERTYWHQSIYGYPVSERHGLRDDNKRLKKRALA